MAAHIDPMMIMRTKSKVFAEEPHSPKLPLVTYWYTGLITILGFIAIAMFIRIAYSFWKLSSGNNLQQEKQDLEAQKSETQVHEEKMFVVMAGEERPTFLATPMWSNRSSSFKDNISNGVCTSNKVEMDQALGVKNCL
ncbi:hypothetical protein TanjilG_27230 [Lupinus angustifolius]|uniref:Uncharacterized protein n=1 Tax=Lupinus angustifolius TaxID=3871 RepID=A0A394D997_LUPAN|nr:PREDICTED: protein GLUTAMINE DUMPER 1-like [Lupinus angustifolius]OIW19864.1 hypothetical protein TanjilG_27230 [Lupinus angustifolius]